MTMGQKKQERTPQKPDSFITSVVRKGIPSPEVEQAMKDAKRKNNRPPQKSIIKSCGYELLRLHADESVEICKASDGRIIKVRFDCKIPSNATTDQRMQSWIGQLVVEECSAQDDKEIRHHIHSDLPNPVSYNPFDPGVSEHMLALKIEDCFLWLARFVFVKPSATLPEGARFLEFFLKRPER